MTHIMKTDSYNDTMQQSYNEKHQSFKPQYKKYYQPSTQELPPTPSSSALSFLVTDQKYLEEEDDQVGRLPLNTAISTARPQSSAANYGSLSSEFAYFQTASPSTVSSPAASTISPNDDDESLYLLWTHQLLRERGYKPSSCKLNENDDDDDDRYSIDSSITDLSVNQQETLSSSNNNRHLNNNQTSSYTPSWLSSCFPMC